MRYFPRNRKRRWLWKRWAFPFLACAALAAWALAAGWIRPGTVWRDLPVFFQSGAPESAVDANSGVTMYHVTKRNVFVCGEETEELGPMTYGQIRELMDRNPDLEVSMISDSHAILTEHIEDLSPECRENAYFGVDEEGNFSLFAGDPKAARVLRTFFQIDIERLESSLPQETVRRLYEGIRVTDYASYHSVLSTFADFAVESGRN